MAGLDLPEDCTIDGVSLVKHFKSNGEKELTRNAIFWHYPHYRGNDVIPYSIIRKGNWKLIKRYEGKTYELFNLQEDLSEERDLSSELPEKVIELDNELTDWLIDVGAKLPKRNPNFKNDK
jgi:arylsulfatase A-like enzyme